MSSRKQARANEAVASEEKILKPYELGKARKKKAVKTPRIKSKTPKSMLKEPLAKKFPKQPQRRTNAYVDAGEGLHTPGG